MAAAVAEAVQVVGVLLILTLMVTPGAAAARLAIGPAIQRRARRSSAGTANADSAA